jgi:hypothetical protein
MPAQNLRSNPESSMQSKLIWCARVYSDRWVVSGLSILLRKSWKARFHRLDLANPVLERTLRKAEKREEQRRRRVGFMRNTRR